MNKKFCQSCGKEIDAKARMCPNCGAPETGTDDFRKSKTTAALLAIFLGGLGAYKFSLDKTGQGILYPFLWFTAVYRNYIIYRRHILLNNE